VKDLSPFDFISAVSDNKKDLIRESDNPALTEKEYLPFIVNRGLSFFDDSILHVNEMNQRHHMFPVGQFDYYRAALRKRKRFSKWFKPEQDVDLDAIQQVYQCSRSIAKLYLKALSKSQLNEIHSRLEKGGN